MADLICSFQGKARFSEQASSHVGASDAKGQPVPQNLIGCDCLEFASLGEFAQCGVVLIVCLSSLLRAVIKTISLERHVLAWLTVLLELLQHGADFPFISIVLLV